MATITQNYKTNTVHVVFSRKFDNLVERLMPRRRMVVSVGMIFAGISIPALMAFKLLPLSLLLGFASLALIAVGGVLTLVYCGEL